MLYLTKCVEFSASHRLHNPDLSDEENLLIFDKCNNPNGHGHNYRMEVTVAGEPDPKSGYVIDLKKLKKLLNDEIITKVDHKHLNYDVDFITGINPTVENIVVIFWDILSEKISSGKLHSIKIYETPDSFVEYRGE